MVRTYMVAGLDVVDYLLTTCTITMDMGSGILRDAVSKILELKIQSARVQEAKDLATKILDIASQQQGKITFERFSLLLSSKLESVCKSCSNCRSIAAKKTKMWTAFHRQRNEELPNMWDCFFKELGLCRSDHLFEQTVNQNLFEMTVSGYFSKMAPATREQQNVYLTKDELNVLQYVGGFVPHALLKRFERSRKYDGVLECLGEMAVIGEHSDFWEYTKEWIWKVNRGGLFCLNDGTFQLFIEMEKRVQQVLPIVLKKPQSDEDKLKDVRENIMRDENVQWQWTLLSQTIESEEDAAWLLEEIIKLYVSIRGFSIANVWIEEYKREHKQSTKKSVGLRKNLT